MAKHTVDVQVEDNVTPVDLEAVVQPVRLAVLVTLRHQQIEEPSEVVVIISDDAALADLNRRFLGISGPTDVLSFPDDTRGPFSGGTVGFPRYLGDIVISLERAQAQADAAGGTLQEELQLLTVHGVLHLLGYDHADEQGKEQMWNAQSDILRLLDVDIPLPE